VDRLEDKSLVRRVASPSDGRSQIVQLTAEGERFCSKVFPAHMEHLEQAFSVLSQNNLESIEATLHQLREAFAAASMNLKEAV